MKNSLALFLILSGVGSLKSSIASEIVFEEDHALPLVFVNLALKAGSINDPKGFSGLTHFTAEMLLRGTRSRTKEQIEQALDQMGAKIDAEVRAESVILRGAVLSSQLDDFLDLMSDIATHPSFPEKEIRKLKSELVSAILAEQANDRALGKLRFEQFLLKGHPYGNPPHGKIKDIDKFEKANLDTQFRKVFQPGKVFVVSAGDVSQAKIQSWADRVTAAYSNFPGTKLAIEFMAPKEPAVAKLQLVNKADRTQTQIHIGQIGMTPLDPRFDPFTIANHVFGGGSFASRLMTEIRVKRGWSYGAGSANREGSKPRLWFLTSFPASKDTVATLELSLKLTQEFAQNGITDAEFGFSKDSLINGSGFAYNTVQKRMENAILEHSIGLPDGFVRGTAGRLQPLTLGQVNDAIRTFLKPSRLAISVLCTSSELKDALIKASGVKPENVTEIQAGDED